MEEGLGDVEADGDRDRLCDSLHGGRLLSLDAFNSSELGTQMPRRGRPSHHLCGRQISVNQCQLSWRDKAGRVAISSAAI